MNIELSFVEFKNAPFVGGKNLGTKAYSKPGLSFTYDQEQKEILVVYGTNVAIIPWSNVTCMHPKEKK